VTGWEFAAVLGEDEAVEHGIVVPCAERLLVAGDGEGLAGFGAVRVLDDCGRGSRAH
jgi:hypothetical protein